MAAFVAMGAGKAVGKDAAAEIAAKGPLNVCRRRLIALPGRECQSGFEVRLNGAIPERFLGSAALVALGLRRDTFDCGIHGASPSWSGDRGRIL